MSEALQRFIIQGMLGWTVGITLCYWFIAMIVYPELVGKVDPGRYWIIALIVFVFIVFLFLLFSGLTLVAQH